MKNALNTILDFFGALFGFVLDYFVLILFTLCMGLIVYSAVGSKGKVGTIKEMAPRDIQSRGWKILRYEGWQYGSWGNHGGKVWYHVADTANPNIQYRVCITLWDGELHYAYGAPEVLQRVEVNYEK